MNPAQYLNTNPLTNSYLPLHMSATMQGLTNLINQNDDLFTQSGDLDDEGKYHYSLSKTESGTVANDGKQLIVTLPINVQITGSSMLLKDIDVQGSLEVTLGITPQLESDWQITTETKLLSHNWTTPPKMEVLGRTISIEWLTDRLISLFKNRLLGKIDDQVAASVAIKDKVLTMWDQIQTAKPIIPQSNLKVVIIPQSLNSTPIRMDTSALFMDIEAIAKLMLLSDSSSLNLPPQPLPNLNIVNDINDESNLQLYVFMDYTEIQQQINRYLSGRDLDVAGRTIQISGVTIKGDQNQLYMGGEITGGVKGIAVLSGKPVYNATTGVFEIDDMQFHFETKNILMKAAGNMFKATIEKKLEELSHINITDALQSYITQINQKLDHYDIGQGAVAHVEVKKLQVLNLMTDISGLHVQAQALGKMEVSY